MESIIAAAIALIGSLAGTYFANRKASALIAYRLEELEKKVEAHNDLIERVYRLEQHNEVQDTKIKEAERRIEDLEEAVRA